MNTNLRPTRVVGDLSTLPESIDGARNVVWWSNFGFMVIEGSGFALAAATALYLKSQSVAWPPSTDRPPDLLWGAIFTVGLLLTEILNVWVPKKAREKDERLVRLGVLAMTTAGALLMVARGFELSHLNIGWETDAYGSVVWLLMFLHTTHVVTQLGETAVVTVWLYTHEIGDDQFADVQDNGEYGTFVVIAWLPIYALVYWLPRIG